MAAENSTLYTVTEDMTHHWVTVKTPSLTAAVLLGYLGLVTLGPRLMASHKPYDLKNVMRVYNVLQIVCCTYLVSKAFRIPGALDYLVKSSCSPDDTLAARSLRNEYLTAAWQVYMLKIVDLLDTCFVVLRKKNAHLSLLHVYHHSSMVFLSWFTIKTFKAPHQAAFPMILNLSIHVILYSYYFLTTFGPTVQKYLWWKKHITMIQMVQMVIDVIYFGLLYYSGCQVSQTFNLLASIQAVIFGALFTDFYIKSYYSKKVKDH